MTYLIAKYLFLLLLATVLGILIGRWSIRRQFVDVSEAYDGFRRTVEAAEQAPWGKLFARIDGLAPQMRRAVRGELEAQPAVEVPSVDLSGIDARLLRLDAQFSDLSLANQKVFDLEKTIHAMPVAKQPESADLVGVNDRLNELSAMVRAFPQQIPQPKPVDLSALEVSLRKMPKDTEWQPFEQRLSRIEEKLSHLVKTQHKAATYAPLDTPALNSVAMGVSSEPVLLKSASFGTKDDLKRISGVGPMLEDLLNEQGVYYFWQISDWTLEDIEAMDAKLGVFKGRIARDDWVHQANQYSNTHDTANRP